MKLAISDFGGCFDYRVASDTTTGQRIDFYHDLDNDHSWYVYSVKGRDDPRSAKTLSEAIDLWNMEEGK